MSSSPNNMLLKAVLEPRRTGAIAAIKDSCAAGANPNSVLREGSTSYGPVLAGMTLLTFSIHHEASRVVEALLLAGADPDLKDDLGWSPWAASTLTDDKRERIQSMLIEAGGKPEGEHLGALARAIYTGDVEQASSLLQGKQDLQTLSTFRVDLVAHQIAHRQMPMLQWLLDQAMPCDTTHLSRAVYASSIAAVEYFIEQGIPVEQDEDNETLLMIAARQGDDDIVRVLVERGADVNRFAFGLIENTASYYAEKSGHKNIAAWLRSQMDDDVLARQKETQLNRNPKFSRLYKAGTSTGNLTTDDIVHQLESWDTQYSLKVTQATDYSVSLSFEKTPDWSEFSQALFQFCPTLIDHQVTVKKKLMTKNKITLWWDE